MLLSSLRKWCDVPFADLTVQTIDHYITYSVISAQPQLTYSSVLSTVRVFPITSGHHEGQSFVQWTGHFSSDADAGICSCLIKEVQTNDTSRCHRGCQVQAS